jgi:Ion channel
LIIFRDLARVAHAVGRREGRTRLTRIGKWRAQAQEPALTALLVIELAVIFVFLPLTEVAVFEPRSLHALFAGIVLIGAISLIARGRGALALTGLTAAVGLLAHLYRYEWPSDLSILVFLLVVLFLLMVLTGVVGRAVFGPGRVSVHRVQGAVVVYLHIALIFTYLQAIVLFFEPGALGTAVAVADASAGAKILYFSFTTLTTVGYGDIVPLHPMARSLANLEGMIGQLYPATLLARLVTLELATREE